MTEKTLTTENIKPALDALRGELAPWPVVAKKQDRLNTAQLNAANSGITSSLVAQIIANTAAIRALESAITGTGLRALVVASLPAVGTTGILYIVPVTTYDPDTDADVVNYSNEYIWIPVEGGTASEGHYEQVGQTGIVINNGQLTITVNGTSVGTFTANQSGDTTAAITVPTNADYVDRTTDQTVAGDKTWTGEQSFTLPIVGSITGTASKAIADEDGNTISSTYGKLSGSQTWTGNNTFTSTITTKTNVDRTVAPASDTTYGTIICRDKNGSAMFRMQGTIKTDLSNTWNMMMVAPNNSYITFFRYTIVSSTDRELRLKVTSVVPDDNATADLGTSTNQWKSVYSQTYYYNGTAWGLDKANVWSAQQKFTGNNSRGVLSIYNPAHTKGSATSVSDLSIGTIFLGDGGATGLANSIGFVSCDLANSGNKTQLSLSAIKNEASSTERANLVIQYDKSDNTNPEKVIIKGAVLPNSDSTYPLGTSTNKWKTLNGVNPGALSLPDSANAITIDTTNWVYDGATSNLWAATVDCWVAVNSVYTRLFILKNNTLNIGSVSERGGSYTNYVYVPARKGDVISLIAGDASGVTVIAYPCLGNV